MTHNRRKINQLEGTLEVSQIIELVDKDIKTVVIVTLHVFKKLKYGNHNNKNYSN